MGKLKDNLNYMIYGGTLVAVDTLVGLLIIIAVLSKSGGVVAALSVIAVLGGIALAVVSIYLAYIRCEMIYNINMACGLKENGDTSRRSRNYVIFDLLCRVTCGIYGVYWFYKQEERVRDAGRRYGIQNQFKTEDKKSFYMLIAGVGCQIGGIIFLFVFCCTFPEYLTRAAWGYLTGSGSGAGIMICGILGALLSIAGAVFGMLAWNLFYQDINLLSAAFNRETDGGNRIICVNISGQGPGSGYGSGYGQGPGSASGVVPLPKGGVRVLSGQYAGSTIQLKNKERIIIGRDKTQCDLVCSSDKVSRVHLSITFFTSAMGGAEYIVKDMSSNGTNSSTTGPLPANQEVRQRPGTVLTLGKSSESVQLL